MQAASTDEPLSASTSTQLAQPLTSASSSKDADALLGYGPIFVDSVQPDPYRKPLALTPSMSATHTFIAKCIANYVICKKLGCLPPVDSESDTLFLSAAFAQQRFKRPEINVEAEQLVDKIRYFFSCFLFRMPYMTEYDFIYAALLLERAIRNDRIKAQRQPAAKNLLTLDEYYVGTLILISTIIALKMNSDYSVSNSKIAAWFRAGNGASSRPTRD